MKSSSVSKAASKKPVPRTADAGHPVAESRGRFRRWAILSGVLLALLVLTVFHPVIRFEFVDFDTNSHVVNNPHIRGLTLENLRLILTTRHVTSYYPVRTLTYALDHQLWGLNAAGFKLTNSLLHLTNVLLLFWLLLRLFSHNAAGCRRRHVGSMCRQQRFPLRCWPFTRLSWSQWLGCQVGKNYW
jgi:hypothetical protein